MTKRFLEFLGLATVVLLVGPTAGVAQCSFSSGSTGADGAFTPTNSISASVGWSVSGNTVTITNRADGVFHFTSVFVETNWTVKFTRNGMNTPVVLLAQSNVTINGTLDLNGVNASGQNASPGGPGGFDGGKGGGVGNPGHGPGYGSSCGGGGDGAGFGSSINGSYCGTNSGRAYGTLDVLPMIGGSGGAGGEGSNGGGGGGGGAALIASSGTITVNGTITAQGGKRGSFSGSGSGGAIKLMANTLVGEGTIAAREGSYGLGSRDATEGRIRIETCTNRRTSLTDPPATFGVPGSVFLATNPTIRVTSIAGVNAPWPPSGSLTNPPDLYLPTNFVNPAVIKVAASNITAGTNFKIIVTPTTGTNLFAASALAGTYSFSTGEVSVAVYTDRVWRVNALIDYIPRP